MAGDYLDVDGSVLFRLDSDGPVQTMGPFIMAVEVDKYVLHDDVWTVLVSLFSL